jgi:hypothetical protein
MDARLLPKGHLDAVLEHCPFLVDAAAHSGTVLLHDIQDIIDSLFQGAVPDIPGNLPQDIAPEIGYLCRFHEKLSLRSYDSDLIQL